MHNLFQNHVQQRWFLIIFLLCAALVLANLVHWFLLRVLHRKEMSSLSPGWGLREHLSRPARTVFVLTCAAFILPLVPDLPGTVATILHQGIAMALVVSLGWLAVGFVYVLQSFLMRKYDTRTADNLRARRLVTQFQLARRLLIALIVVITIGGLLYTFHDPRIWEWGTGLVASAGLASLVLATAAKSTASNIFAGFQIALTEPIRIDDVVVVQNEWGRIEEITSAYVVIRLWDLRRLIVPLTWFIENSFQNWSRESAEVMGTSMLYVDYTVPVEPLRQELLRFVKENSNYNGKVCALQVTNLTEHTMEIRCLMSSNTSSALFDLRCQVREHMIEHIKANYPDAFPRTRITGPGEGEHEPTEASRFAAGDAAGNGVIRPEAGKGAKTNVDASR